jgi:hypothetical protein
MSNVLLHEMNHAYGLSGIQQLPSALMIPQYHPLTTLPLNRQTIDDIQRWRDNDCVLTVWDLERKAAVGCDAILEMLLEEELGPPCVEPFPSMFYQLLPSVDYGHMIALSRADFR